MNNVAVINIARFPSVDEIPVIYTNSEVTGKALYSLSIVGFTDTIQLGEVEVAKTDFYIAYPTGLISKELFLAGGWKDPIKTSHIVGNYERAINSALKIIRGNFTIRGGDYQVIPFQEDDRVQFPSSSLKEGGRFGGTENFQYIDEIAQSGVKIKVEELVNNFHKRR